MFKGNVYEIFIYIRHMTHVNQEPQLAIWLSEKCDF